jgi:hypothetical protein
MYQIEAIGKRVDVSPESPGYGFFPGLDVEVNLFFIAFPSCHIEGEEKEKHTTP